jgi:DNA-binding NarL/FixJ family response regulator
MPTVLFLTTDMMFSSRVLGAAKAFGLDCRLVAKPEQLAATTLDSCPLALIDLGLSPLDLGEAVAAIRASAPQARIVAFGPHVDHRLLAAASDAGCDLVLPRSQFHQRYVELLQAAAQG